MVKFRPTCRECYHERGQTILLEEKSGDWVCPVNPRHRTADDIEVA